MRRPYIIIMCSLLLTACTADNEPTGYGSVAVFFDANVQLPAPTTRAKGEINKAVSANETDNDELRDYDGFGVFACYTGLHGYSDSNVKPNFMYNEHVTWNSTNSVWAYSPLKYWPNGEGEATSNTGSEKHYVSFMAYAPYSDTHNNASGYCIPSFSLQGEIGNPWLTYRLHDDVDRQVDLLYAAHSIEHPILDQTKPQDPNSKVLFDFKHALACVGDKITIIPSEGIKNQVDSRVVGSVTKARVVVKNLKIEYTLTSKARLVLWNNGEPNWQTILSESPVCERTVTIVPNATDAEITVYSNGDSDASTEITDKGVFYIPKELDGYPQTAKVTITYCISTNNGSWIYESDNTGSAILMLSDYADAYQSGKHLYINVTLNQMSIGLTAAIAPWEESDPVEMQGIED